MRSIPAPGAAARLAERNRRMSPTYLAEQARNISTMYRDLGDPPPDLTFTAGLACSMCHDQVRLGANAWACTTCTAAWDLRGMHGTWTTPAPARAPALTWQGLRAAIALRLAVRARATT